MEADAFTELEKTLPPVFARTEVSRLFPGMISPGRLANMMKEGTAPPHFKVGRKACFTRGAFVQWMRSRSGVEAVQAS